METIDKYVLVELYFEKYNYTSIVNMKKKLELIISKILFDIDNISNWTANTASNYIRTIDKMYEDVYSEVEDDYTEELAALMALFISTEAFILDEDIKTSIASKMDFKNDIVLGYTLSEMFNQISMNSKISVKKILKSGLLNKTSAEMRGSLYQAGVLTPTNKSLTSARTYSKFQRENIREETDAEGVDIAGFLSVAIIDSRTSSLCRGLHNTFYPIEEYKSRVEVPNRPPRHFNCRSTLVRVSKKDEDVSKNLNTSFTSFLDRNPDEVEKLLGKKIFNMMKSGNYTISEYLNSNKNMFTLDKIANSLDFLK